MEFKIFNDYFQTKTFSEVAQNYMATVLPALFDDNPTRESKGHFVKNGKVLYDGYDMPYHIHILNGLIPMLFVYEKFLLNNNTHIEDPNTIKFLKILMLGFTFHDANKMFADSKDVSLVDALTILETKIANYQVSSFFSEWEAYQSYIYFLALQTENRTSVQANKYAIRQQDYKLMTNELAKFCHLADALASLSEFDDVENVAETIQKHLGEVQTSVQVSYIKIQPNPYHLLSQTVLLKARQVLYDNHKIPFYKLQSGVLYFGEPFTEEEYQLLIQSASESDLKASNLTNINAQTCTFNFIGTIPFTTSVLNEIINKLANNFLQLSPNGSDKINNYGDFVQGIEELIKNYNLPIAIQNEKGKLRLNFVETCSEDWQNEFIKLVALYKMRWLNSKNNKEWEQEYKLAKQTPIELQTSIQVGDNIWHNSVDVLSYLATNTASPDANTKTFLAILRAHYDIFNSDVELEETKQILQKQIITWAENNKVAATDSENTDDTTTQFIKQYVVYQNANLFQMLLDKDIVIPAKNAMCTFTGAPATEEYKEGLAFGLKARGGSNRTVSTLKNTTSHISELFAQENRLRKNEFAKATDANTMVYQDFYEANLDVQRDLFQALASRKEKALIKVENEHTISFEFDKNKGLYNLYNLTFINIGSDIESVFHVIYKYLRLTKALGVRTYITGIMSPYTPHFACFRYQSAPRFVQQLGWDNVRLVELESVLKEMRLLLTIGGNFNGNVLQVAESRQAYFRIYARLDKDGKSKVHNVFNDFITQNRSKFTGMTTIEQLADIALRLDKGTRSGSNETWIIRIGLEHLRRNVKEKRTREDVIEKIAGQFYKNLRQDHWTADKQAAAGEFAAALYDTLFVQEWKQNLPTINREKDWIYQFGYVFSQKCQEFFSAKKAESEKAAN